jgi:hypothetical protein
MDVDAVLAGLYELVAPHLTEKQRRLLAGAAARALGRGGGARMARLTGLSRPTVYTGVRELDDSPDPRGRVRRPGGGPKRQASHRCPEPHGPGHRSTRYPSRSVAKMKRDKHRADPLHAHERPNRRQYQTHPLGWRHQPVGARPGPGLGCSSSGAAGW